MADAARTSRRHAVIGDGSQHILPALSACRPTSLVRASRRCLSGLTRCGSCSHRREAREQESQARHSGIGIGHGMQGGKKPRSIRTSGHLHIHRMRHRRGRGCHEGDAGYRKTSEGGPSRPSSKQERLCIGQAANRSARAGYRFAFDHRCACSAACRQVLMQDLRVMKSRLRQGVIRLQGQAPCNEAGAEE